MLQSLHAAPAAESAERGGAGKRGNVRYKKLEQRKDREDSN